MTKSTDRTAELRRRWEAGDRVDQVGIVSVIVATGSFVLGLAAPPLLAVTFLALVVMLVAAAVKSVSRRRALQVDEVDAPTVTLAVIPAMPVVDRGAERAARRAERAGQREAKREHARTHYTVMMGAWAPRLTIDAELGTLRRGSEKNGEVRSMHGVTIDIDGSGSVNRRLTATRMVALGPLALSAKKRVDDRSLHVVVNGPDFQWSWQVEGDHGRTVRAYMARVTTSVRQWQSSAELRDPARGCGVAAPRRG